VSEVEMMSSTQRKIGFHISQQIVQPIDSFVNRKLNKQVSLIGSGQNMLQTLKADLVAMSGERERYVKPVSAFNITELFSANLSYFLLMRMIHFCTDW
jgi:hypothetical protein